LYFGFTYIIVDQS